MRTRWVTIRRAVALLGVACVPYLACVPYDDAFEPPSAASSPSTDTAGSDRDAKPDNDVPSVIPFVACTNPGEALLLVQQFAYRNQCGCEEEAGLDCTVAAGTTVRWHFSDAESHNVTSDGELGASADLLVGDFEHTFDVPGTYQYACTVHPVEMANYSIVVR